MTEAQAKTHKHNPFDLTKVWPKKDYPLIEVGVMELNRNPDNYFAEVEQAAFSPANVVPGHRLLARQDAAGAAVLLRRRAALPARRQLQPYPGERAEMPVPQLPSRRRDAHGRQPGRHAPATIPTAPASGRTSRTSREPPLPVDGEAAHWDHRVDEDHWEQPGNLFRLMTPAQQQALFENTARAMGDAREHIKQRHVENCTRADPAYGAGVARALGTEALVR